MPTPAILQKARHKARRCGRAENEQVVQSLGLTALIRTITCRHQRGRSDEQEIPADAVDGQCNPEIPLDGAVLVRPDGHVAWRSRSGASNHLEVLRAALDCVFGGMPAIA
jgi:hypothetical protein